jgi:cobalt transporter subunit CbtB
MPRPRVAVSPEALSKGRVMVVLGKTMVVHEWVHDARHFLGFPCH